ncbi:hypothetical protein LTR95_001395 [Oleoguttula sp. CCFEE 5521]
MAQRPRKLYFAYGSNIRMSQMADRCPSSLYRGTATLTGYRWQINERGVANIVESPCDCVEGLLFSIDELDEKTLDRSEGIRLGYYEKKRMLVLSRNLPKGPLKTTYLARQMQEGLFRARFLAQQQQDDKDSEKAAAKQGLHALVYISTHYVQNGYIREEFASRMKAAMADASLLGVSRQYLGRYLYPAVYGLLMRPEQEAAQKLKRPRKLRQQVQSLPEVGHSSTQAGGPVTPKAVPNGLTMQQWMPMQLVYGRPRERSVQVQHHFSAERMSPPPRRYTVVSPSRSRSADPMSRIVNILDDDWRHLAVVPKLTPRSGWHEFYMRCTQRP